jgi:hypothetical protein
MSVMQAMTRRIHGHESDPLNNSISILSDNPDESNGNSPHFYHLIVDISNGVPSLLNEIKFQRGPVREVGINGITNEALLSIVADRLRGFQLSEYGSDENEMALVRIEEALTYLHLRTESRIDRGVEGTSKV